MVISPALRQRIDFEIARVPVRAAAVLPVLQLVQLELGCVVPDVARELSSIFAVDPTRVAELVAFYPMLRSTLSAGRRRVGVCTGLPCALRGAAGLLAGLEQHLGIRAGETSDDGRVHLVRDTCLGACGQAPLLSIDSAHYGSQVLADACRVVDSLE